MRYTSIPALTGKQLIKLLVRDGWGKGRKCNHGLSLTKIIRDRTKVAFIPDTRASLPKGILHDILGQKQMGIGKEGLLKLLNRYGL